MCKSPLSNVVYRPPVNSILFLVHVVCGLGTPDGLHLTTVVVLPSKVFIFCEGSAISGAKAITIGSC